VGNLFLSGARLFCGSLDSAIELLMRITRVPSNVAVLPALNTNFTHHISAVLQDGTLITGQSQISHPSPLGPQPVDSEYAEDANLPFTHPALTRSQVFFSKDDVATLPSPIERVHYINPFGQEIKPRASSRVLAALDSSNAVIYSVGSLYTSIIPVLMLQEFGTKLRNRKDMKKIMLLNGTEDRETHGMTAVDHVRAVVEACLYSSGSIEDSQECDWSAFVTDLVHLNEPNGISVDVAALRAQGIRTHYVPHVPGETGLYDISCLEQTLLSQLHSR
jgi:2-phospho-L-lactate transferase/gluconeogenesis factor (CofD/UPF0052 family)